MLFSLLNDYGEEKEHNSFSRVNEAIVEILSRVSSSSAATAQKLTETQSLFMFSGIETSTRASSALITKTECSKSREEILKYVLMFEI